MCGCFLLIETHKAFDCVEGNPIQLHRKVECFFQVYFIHLQGKHKSSTWDKWLYHLALNFTINMLRKNNLLGWDYGLECHGYLLSPFIFILVRKNRLFRQRCQWWEILKVAQVIFSKTLSQE